jgi:hypothetical protein
MPREGLNVHDEFSRTAETTIRPRQSIDEDHRRQVVDLQWLPDMDSNHGSETKRARETRAQRTLEEAKAAVTVSRRGGTQDMIVWVPEWFRVRYSNSPLTLTKYLESWHAISVFFEERRIRRAEQVRREDVISFVEWRQQPTNGGVRAASRNTALHDLKVLRAILYEALRRGWAAAASKKRACHWRT